MKKRMIIGAIILITLSVFLLGCNSQPTAQEQGDQSLEEIKENGKLIMGLDDSFPPMGFKDEKGEIVGFDIDLAKEVTKKLGIELELKPIDWAAKELSLSSGDIDVIWNGFSISEKRKEKVLFSEPYLKNDQIIAVGADSSIKNKQDLKDKIVGLQMESTSATALNAEPDVKDSLKEIKEYENNVEALLDLKSGRTDAVIVDEVVGKYYIAQKPGEYKVLEENFGAEFYAVGFRKEDKALKEAIDKAIDELVQEGIVGEISKKWFGEDIVLR